jgi:hypothetical protein
MPAIRRNSVPNIYDLGIPDDYALNGTNWNTGISNSMLSGWTFCRYLFLVVINRYRRPDKVFTTGFGTLFHDILELTYQYVHDNFVFPSLGIVKKWLIEWEERNTDDMRSDEVKEKDLLLAEILMEGYMKFYYKDVTDYKIISLEEKFDEQFHGYRLRGKIDGVLGKIADDRFYTFEHKTKGQIVSDVIKQILTFDPQNLFYITAKERQDVNTKYVGTVYNIIRNPKHKILKNESLRMFRRKVRLDIQGRPQHFFVRFTQPYSQEIKDLYKIHLISKLKDIQLFLDRGILPYPNESACHRQWACEHLNACSSGQLIGYKKYDKLFPELEE